MLIKNKKAKINFSIPRILPNSRKAWIRIVEAFVAILLIIGVLLIIIDKGYIKKKDISSEVYDAELSILREIQLNNTLREDILNAGPIPVKLEDFPLSVKSKITNGLPNYLDCDARICKMENTCTREGYLEKDIYAKSVIITTTLTDLNYRQLKLFCWAK